MVFGRVPFYWGYKMFFWDTTFHECGAYFGMHKLFFRDTLFFGGDTIFFLGHIFFWDTIFFRMHFFGDTRNFLVIQNVFRDTKCFFGYKILFFGKQKFSVDQNPQTSQKLQKFKNNFYFFKKKKDYEKAKQFLIF